MEFAWLRLTCFSILTIGDVGVAVYYRLIQQEETKVLKNEVIMHHHVKNQRLTGEFC